MDIDQDRRDMLMLYYHIRLHHYSIFGCIVPELGARKVAR